MKTLEQIFEIIEENEISIHKYEEDKKLFGYELSTFTQGGVNEILFLDFRSENQNPENVSDFIKEFKDYINSQSIDDRIERNRQSPLYRNDFTIKESLKDFTNFQKKLKRILKLISK
tara:strand:- start:76 stop:426 length:351 start_codon:yes stop_codon:yes gene_type:complete